jgi:hypothetical protein
MTRALLAITLVGCLSVPKLGQPTCSKDSDCPIAGEVCQMNVCWGSPPTGMFGATLSAPSSRNDLIGTEVPAIAMDSTGWVSGLALAAPVAFGGHVQGCAGTAPCVDIAAEIRIARPSRIIGLAPVSFSTTSDPTVQPTADAFHILIPGTGPNDPPYTATVIPDPSGRLPDTPPSAATAAQLVPPLQVALPATGDINETFLLGGTTIITGSLVDQTSNALKGYRVSATGHFALTPMATDEVSTVAWSTDGHFTITISPSSNGSSLDLVAKPYGGNPATVTAPELHVTIADGASTQRTVTQPPNVGMPVKVAVPVLGQTSNGMVSAVVGATVVLHAEYTPPLGNINQTRAIVDARVQTDSSGLANLTVPDGSAFAYKLDIIPPANSNLGVIYGQSFSVGDSGKLQYLPSRVGIHSTVLDSNGNVLQNVAVTVKPSLRFLWAVEAIDELAARLLGAIPPATAVSSSAGDFVVWVDPTIGTTWGFYDITFDPPAAAGAPRWTLTAIEIPRVQNQTSLAVDNVTLPDAAYVHGSVTDPAGGSVVGSDVHIYEIVTDTSPCTALNRPPTDCVIPARDAGDGTSDAHGVAAVTLAR